MKLLVVNPNTTASMTATIAAAARAVAHAETEVVAVTSAMGPASIEGYYDEAFAVPGLIRAIRDGEAAGADAAVIACFDDTGLDAARAAVAIPVLGLCEAGLSLAAMLAPRIGIVTTLARSRVPLEHLVQRYGMAGRAIVRAADIPVLSLEDPTSGAKARLSAEIERTLEEDGAEAILLGCAGMADLAAALSDAFRVPVVDGVGAAVKQAEALVALGLRTSKHRTYAPPLTKPYAGLMADFEPR
ncbi:aspartate/glutamate racemase family protein [Aurantimonas sp. MSK8Z-1]|uniref:aspartate/glutamate racemase family protein n=1 Tax=Mangrovibrevibacter kandeliae TaxID=2968473 RepID=UPI0021176FE4|nr:aspartate/glutamate racemase family protein [Aurantimonas sp. MSK8Z-1]MCW4115015.1 aspartate/glutamate racemase family protein [Aurantimonas sp. MSK8Z-1]